MIVLDTHVLVWWVNGDLQLSPAAIEAIEASCGNDGAILVSSITAWELAMLVAKGRMSLTMDIDVWIATVAAIDAVRFVPVDTTLAIESVNLPGEFHADPADRLLVALARHFGVPLVTADQRIRDYPFVRSIW